MIDDKLIDLSLREVNFEWNLNDDWFVRFKSVHVMAHSKLNKIERWMVCLYDVDSCLYI